MAIYSRLSIQNINDRRFWIWKNKFVIESNKQPGIEKSDIDDDNLISQILIKYIYVKKIQMKQNINI